MDWGYKFLIIAMAVAVASGFVFMWHRWNLTRSPLWLALSIVMSVVVALCIVFAAASVIIMLLGL